MSENKRTLSTDELGILLFLAALIFGTWFRVYPPYAAGFPINDGGLFYRMIETIQHDQYRLPSHVEYNGLRIPFAYPPLALYVAGILSDISGVELLDIVQWFPGIILILVLPAIYLLARLLLRSSFQAGLATLLYALLPRSVSWLIMGGGLTRAPGQFFLVLAAVSFYLLFTTQKTRHLILSIVFSSLVCLTHPEAAVHAIGTGLLFLLFHGRNREGVKHAGLVALGTFLCTSPWWMTILLRFGAHPFLSAAQTGLHSASYLIVFFVPFSGEPFQTIISLLAILGFATRVAGRDYLLPAWYVLPFIIEPRSAANVSIIPMVLLASLALAELVFPGLSKLEQPASISAPAQPIYSRAGNLLSIYLLVCLLIGMQYFELDLHEKRVSPNQRAAFEWIDTNTPPNSTFLVLTGTTDLFADPINEWFPVFTKRVSLTTIQGYEWIGQGHFATRVEMIQKIQQCLRHASPLACVEEMAGSANLEYDFIFVARTVSQAGSAETLIGELKDSSWYTSVHETGGAAIFQHNH